MHLRYFAATQAQRRTAQIDGHALAAADRPSQEVPHVVRQNVPGHLALIAGCGRDSALDCQSPPAYRGLLAATDIYGAVTEGSGCRWTGRNAASPPLSPRDRARRRDRAHPRRLVPVAMVSMAEHLAGLGYFVLLLEMYYRHGLYEPFDLATAFSEGPERDRMFGMITGLTKVMAAGDAGAFLEFLADRPEVASTTVGTTGYCMGGGLSLTGGHHPDGIVAAASLHGGIPASDAPGSPHLVVGRITGRVVVAAAREDASFPPEQAERLEHAIPGGSVDHIRELSGSPRLRRARQVVLRPPGSSDTGHLKTIAKAWQQLASHHPRAAFQASDRRTYRSR